MTKGSERKNGNLISKLNKRQQIHISSHSTLISSSRRRLWIVCEARKCGFGGFVFHPSSGVWEDCSAVGIRKEATSSATTTTDEFHRHKNN